MTARPQAIALDSLGPEADEPDAHTAAGRRPAAVARSSLAARTLRALSGVAAALAVLCLLTLVAAPATGHRLLVDRGESMSPALHAGDLIVNRTTAAEALAVGDIVTFEDPLRERSITHRIVQRRTLGARIAFVTRGDANTGEERWSAARREPLGRLVASVPDAGRAIGWLTVPLVRLALVVLSAIVLCGVTLRWIWGPR